MVTRCVLDTNAIIALLQGEAVLNLHTNIQWIGVSIISILEFLSFSDLSSGDRKLFEKFVSRVDVVNLSVNNHRYLELAISIRKETKLKLPDALIAASAIHNKATLITKDSQLSGIAGLKVIGW
jgi:tRNA(fMet)-specific endonuclease VapC